MSDLHITIEHDTNRFIVSDDFSLVYGDGETPITALRDYVQSLVEYHDIIKRSATEGNGFDQQKMARFRELGFPDEEPQWPPTSG